MRIGINVPDELLRRVKEIRPQVNVSQVCREALERYVEIAERAKAQAIDDHVDVNVDRLAQSVKAPMIEPDWVAYALDDARDWIRTVTPENWKWFTCESDIFRRQGRDEAELVAGWSGSGDCKGFTNRLWDNGEWYDYQFEEHYVNGGPDPYNKAREEYSRAWLGYVHEARRMLENRYKEEYDRVMAERAEYRKSRPDPEPPQRLV